MAEGDALMVSVSGVRGVVGSTLTPTVVTRFAGALAGFVHERRGTGKGRPLVIVGRDGRRGGEVFADMASAALRAGGCDVLMIDTAMTPTAGVLVDQLMADAGLVITASHNPQVWNGLKPILRQRGAKGRGVSASAPGTGTIAPLLERYHAGSTPLVRWDALGELFVEPLAAVQHAEVVLGLMRTLKVDKLIAKNKFRVVCDNLGCSGTVLGPAFLGALGCTVTELYDQGKTRGVFPHTPEPLAENLVALARATKKHRAHVGFAQDPDADRLAIVDERGRYIGEEYTLVLAAMALGELGQIKRGSTMVVNLSTSRMIEDVAARYGARVVRSAVGEANVVEAMLKHKAVLGGEGNGGVIWPRVTLIRDSLSAMALVLALLAKTGQSVSELVGGVPSYAIVKRKVSLASREVAQAVGEKLARHHAGKPIDRTDGVRVEFPDQRAWLHVRASNTEPIMRLIAEAPSVGVAEKILDQAGALLK